MKVTIDRKRRGEEGVALTVYVREEKPEHYWQFKSDVWSMKDSGEFNMRLDGFLYVHMWTTNELEKLMIALAALDVDKVIAQGNVLRTELKKVAPDLPEPPELIIAEYFETARTAVLKELSPLFGAGTVR